MLVASCSLAGHSDPVFATDTSSLELSGASCTRHFESLSRKHGLRPPVTAFAERAAMSNRLNTTNRKCEAVVYVHSSRVFVHNAQTQPDLSKLHRRALLDNLRSIAKALPATATFVAGLHSADLGSCTTSHTGLKELPSVVSSVAGDESLPPLLLPIHGNQVLRYLKQRAKRPVARKQNTSAACVWHGSKTGHAKYQSAHASRSTCAASETDRQCVVKLAAGALSGQLEASFDKSAAIFEAPCILAVDGNSYAGLFKDTLLQGSLALRVGGHVHGGRPAGSASPYEWYEPLLVDGTHYLRTEIDGLQNTLAALPPSADLKRIAAKGRNAALALFDERAFACYNLLAANELAARQPATLAAAAAAHPSSWTEVRLGISLPAGASKAQASRMRNATISSRRTATTSTTRRARPLGSDATTTRGRQPLLRG